MKLFCPLGWSKSIKQIAICSRACLNYFVYYSCWIGLVWAFSPPVCVSFLCIASLLWLLLYICVSIIYPVRFMGAAALQKYIGSLGGIGASGVGSSSSYIPKELNKEIMPEKVYMLICSYWNTLFLLQYEIVYSFSFLKIVWLNSKICICLIFGSSLSILDEEIVNAIGYEQWQFGMTYLIHAQSYSYPNKVTVVNHATVY